MNLKSLLLCADEKIVRVLRRTLGELDIAVDVCGNAEEALRKLTRERFEAIIVDCAGPGAAEVLRNARSSPGNKRAVAVAILDPDSGMRSGFESGANFVLYKPVSVERSKSSFRAARALMKKERRRNSRIEVRISLEMVSRESGVRFKVNSTDLGEGGLAISLPKGSKPRGRWELSFKLPGSDAILQVDAEFAWESSGTQVGLRFHDQTPEFMRQLRDWLVRNSPDAEPDDPPSRCQLTDLSLGGCYLDIPSPFPVSTRVTLAMRAAGTELKAEGVVRVMHPEKGMGVEFSQTTAGHRELLEQFLRLLSENRAVMPELTVEPEGLETETSNTPVALVTEDALLRLFVSDKALSSDAFQIELQKQRGVSAVATVSV